MNDAGVTMSQRDIDRETRSRVLQAVLQAITSMDDQRRRVWLAWMVGQLSSDSLQVLELRLRKRGLITQKDGSQI